MEFRRNWARKMTKICSIDIDGILNYYPACWVDFINRETGLNFKDKAEAKRGLSPEEYRSLKDRYRKSEFKANLPIRQSALELLKHLKDKGYLITLVTSRPFENYPLLADVTAKWLTKNNIPYDTLIKKSALLSGKLPYLDFHIDDEIEDINKKYKVKDCLCGAKRLLIEQSVVVSRRAVSSSLSSSTGILS